MKLFWIPILLLSFLVLPLFCWAAPAVTVTFGSSGLASLRYGGTEMLWQNPGDNTQGEFDGTSFWVSRVTLRGADGKVQSVKAGGPSRVSVNTIAGTVTRTFSWGTVQGRFLPAGNRLGLTLTVKNTSRDTTIQAILLQPLWLRFPQKPREYAQEYPLLTAGRDAPGIVTADYGTGVLALGNDDVRRPLLIGFPGAQDRPADTIFPLQVSSGPADWLGDLLTPYLNRTIAPGQTDTYHLSLRFGPSGTKSASLTADLDQRFAQTFPMALKWPDRRPIGYLMLSSTVPHSPSGRNPRGWFNNDAAVDVTTAGGRAAFQKQLTAYADSSIRVLHAMNAQGMITWDIEGQEYPHATSYIGDPRLVSRLAPEMEPLADAYFARFRRAGFKVGVCIRPQLLVKAPDGSASQHDQADMTAITRTLIAKALAANKRWGCTLFYVDSNGDPNVPFPASVFQSVAVALAQRKITVLLMPEHQSVGYYGLTAPYDELRGGVTGTPERIRRVYPGAFTVLCTSGGDIAGHRAELTAAVRRGDILLFRAWWDDPENAQVKAIYDEAKTGRAIISEIPHRE